MECNTHWLRDHVEQHFPLSVMNTVITPKYAQYLMDQQISKREETFAEIEHRAHKQRILNRIHQLERQIAMLRTEYGRDKRNTAKPVVYTTVHCARPTCKGIVNNDGECVICNKTTCVKCREVFNEGHECNPDTIQTIKTIQHETRSCPKCNINIFKIDGCDQMWCTQCRTAFSWTTGEIEIKIHNPHYYEWLRNTRGTVPRDVNDGCMNNMNDNNALHNAAYILSSTTILAAFLVHVRNIIHINEVIIQGLNYKIQRYFRTETVEINILYMTNKLSETDYKSTLVMNDKTIRQLQSQRDILATCVYLASGVILDVCGNIHAGNKTETELYNEAITQLNTIAEFTNSSFNEFKKRYKKQTLFHINPNTFAFTTLSRSTVNDMKEAQLKKASEPTQPAQPAQPNPFIQGVGALFGRP